MKSFWPTVLCLIIAINTAAQQPPTSYAITNVKVVVTGGKVLEPATVVISDGLISAVGSKVAIPAEAMVIDGKGLVVYPGLIDAFTDIGIQDVSIDGAKQQQFVQGPEQRPATTPWLIAATVFKSEDKRIETWRQSGFTAILSVPQKGIVAGQSSLINLSGEEAAKAVVKPKVALHLSFQSTGGFGTFPSSLMGIIAYVRQLLLDSRRYSKVRAAYEVAPQGLKRPEYDPAAAELAEILEAGLPVTLIASSASEIRRIITLAQEFKIKPIIVGAQQGYEVANELAACKCPAIVNLKWPEKNPNADPEADEPLRILRLRAFAPSTPAALAKAGVKFAFYSGGLSPKEALKKVKKAIDAGLRPEDGINALTIWPAEIFGVASQLGSIEVGKIANLVVTDGELFDEKTKVKMVFVDGRKFEIREAQKSKQPPEVDLSGKWTLTLNTPQGQQDVTLDLKMAPDGTLSGTISSHMGTIPIDEGQVSGTSFSIKANLSSGQRSLTISFYGKVDNKELKGTINFGDLTSEFTGRRPEVER
ncbi:MAG: amidohydrolase family protein [Acidobacteriota bacterium]|nr:amidohydrolase family protein [Blastocatellia bacterium]MDW8412896.1 amidohydrolase family protein [Acidobacteriota bacterium]